MKEALFVGCDGSYEILSFLKRGGWIYDSSGRVDHEVRLWSDWDIAHRVIGGSELVYVRNILNVNDMCIWRADPADQPVNKFATALRRVSYMPDKEEIRGDVLITGSHTYGERTSRFPETNRTLTLYSQWSNNRGTIRTLNKKRIKLLIQRIELGNRLGKLNVPVPVI